MDYSQLPGRDEQACLLINYAEGIHEVSVKKLLLITPIVQAQGALPPEIQFRWRQEAVVRAFASLYPEKCFANVTFPFILTKFSTTGPDQMKVRLKLLTK